MKNDIQVARTRSPGVGQRLRQGLGWLEASDEVIERKSAVTEFSDFLDQAPQPKLGLRWTLARIWPLLAAINGVLAMNALMLWPSRSGVHLLVFLLALVVVPFVLVLWTSVSGLIRGSAPWWRWLVSPQRDPLMNLWSCRQALLAQGSFALAALAWMWLMLVSRQVVFYWSTSITWVSQRIDGFFQGLSLGLIDAPRPLVISASEAGAITGWESALLSYSPYWAAWLSQVLVLWVLVPSFVMALVCHGRLRRLLTRWPEHNARLRRVFHHLREDSLHYAALEPNQPDASLADSPLSIERMPLKEPGFGWLNRSLALPSGSVPLGQGGHKADEASVRHSGVGIRLWYCDLNQVATGDLADLIQLHSQQCDHPTVMLLVTDPEPENWRDLMRSWQTFIERQRLRVQLRLVQPEWTSNG
ncbi:MAG: DUF2868 domain-containing protein [Saccharospirillum sp.]